MKSSSLARMLPVLESFDAQRPAHARLDAYRPDLHVVEFDEPEPAPAPSFSIDSAEVGQVHWQEGYEAGVAVGRAQAQSESMDQDVLLRDAVAAARAEWLSEQSERIATGVEKALGFIEAEICKAAARILAQVAGDAMRQRALAEFSERVRDMLRGGEAGVVTIHAHEDLIASLQDRLGDVASLEFIAAQNTEVWVRSDATLVETRLGTWRSDHFSGA